MRFALFLGVLSLGLASGALFLNDSLSDLVRDQLDAIDTEDVVAFQHVSVTSKTEVTVLGATLNDPATGRVVAHVDRLDLRLEIPWKNGSPAPRLSSLRGRGGRVLLRYEQDALGLVRAISALLDRIVELIPQSPSPSPAGESGLPELYFEDLELVVYGEGFPLERYPGSAVRIRDLDDEILEVMIATGSEGGTMQLLFDKDGLSRMETRGFRTSPVVTTLDAAAQDVLKSGFAATGALDMVADFDADVVYGTLYEAYVDTEHVPFLLGPATIPFHVDEQNVLRIEESRLGFDGGEVVMSIEASEHDATMRIDVDGAEFREKIMQLIPGYEDWEGVHCSDEGSFECHLDIVMGSEFSEATVTGDGGFHIARIELSLHDIVLEDVVGRFEVTEQHVLSFPDISARVLGGRIRASGTLNLLTDIFRMDLAVEDLDVASLHRLRRDSVDRTDEIAGWLQGRIRARGRLQDPASFVADGQISVRAGNFWDTPTFEQILKVLTMSSDVEGHQRVDAQFTVLDKLVRIQPLEIQSDVLSLSGSGTIRFNHSIRFELRPAPVRLGMFGKVLDTLKEELLVKLTVRGTLDEPRVTATPLNIVARPFRRFWGFLFGEPSTKEQTPKESPSDG